MRGHPGAASSAAKRRVDRDVHRQRQFLRARAGHARGAAAPFTLGVDIGGTNIKASVLDAAGVLAAEQIRSPTPKPATPQAVLETIAKLAAQLPPFQRISVGFPGVVNGGQGSSPHPISAPTIGRGSS